MTTIVSVDGNSGTSTDPGLSIPTVADGDHGIAIFQFNTSPSVTTFDPPSGWTVIGVLGPLSGNNCQSYLCTKDSPFVVADSLTSMDGLATGTTPRWVTGLVTYRDGVFSSPPVNMSDNTLDATLTFNNSFTPDNDGELGLVLAGITTVSAGGPYTVTPPTGGWAEQLDMDLGSATLSNVGVWIGTKALGAGTGGVAQTIPNGAIATGSPTVRMNAWAVSIADQPPGAIPPVRYRKTASGVTGMTTFRKRA